ncbi:MAG: anthranilate synthase component I [Syntrophales bacterium]|nr:anthranilate synthase component I [Syntrophales bacterium]
MIEPSFAEFVELSRRGNIIPVYREVLADTETPVTVLFKFSQNDPVFLLESVEGGEKWGRYSFLGFDPRMVVTVGDEEVRIREYGEEKVHKHNGDPFGFLRKFFKKLKVVSVGELPRFCGGAVGYISYEAIRFFESRLSKIKRAGDGWDYAAFMITDTLVVFDHVKHTLKVVALAYVDGGDLKSLYETCVQKIDKVVRRLRDEGISGFCTVPVAEYKPEFKSNMEPEEFKSMVERAKMNLVNGDIIQVVLAQKFTAVCELSPVNLYRALRFINPSPYLFFLRFGDRYIIGSSPEVLVRLEGYNVELRPIAGTRPRGKTEQEDRKLADELLKDMKEKAEHVMLVDLARNDLGRIARLGSVQVTSFMNVERYSHVMHLVSTVVAELDDGNDAFDVFKSVFPAGTLTGAPKIRAMEIIDELEPVGRGPYGGAVGYFSFNGGMDFAITIRTILMSGNQICVQAGAGIVADSDPVGEFEETMNKAAGMITAVQMAASGLDLVTLQRGDVK